MMVLKILPILSSDLVFHLTVGLLSVDDYSLTSLMVPNFKVMIPGISPMEETMDGNAPSPPYQYL